MTISEMASKSAKKVAATLKHASRPLQRFWPGSSEAAIGLIALVVVLFISATFYTPLAVQASKLVTGNRYLALIDGLINPFRNRQLLLKSGLPIYDIRISKGQYAIIENAIAQAKARGWMSDDEQTWADGKFYYEGQEYNVKVRVRGDLPVHWVNPKKSWRVKFGNQDIEYNGETTREPIYFQGKRQINLIIPIDRDYVVAAFVNQMLREAGLVVPQDQFVILRINGVLQGLYYEVEQFDKPLFAAQERPETEVFSQSERALHFEQYTKIGTPIASDANYDLGMMRGQVEEGNELGMRAMQVLVDFANNPTAANFRLARSVLDWEKYLRFRNITTLFNTNHVRFGSNNIKMYFDPSRGLLEPIPWNVLLVRMPREPGTIDYYNSHGPDPLEIATLQDPELRLQRNKLLWEWVSDGGDNLISEFDKFHEQVRPLAWADVLSTPIQGYRMDELRSDFVFNVHRVYRVLSFSSGNLNYRLNTNDQASLEFVADNFSGITYESIKISDSKVIAGHYQLYQDVNENGELDPADLLVTEADALNGTVRLDLNKTVLPEVQYDSDWYDGKYWEYFDTLAGRTNFFLVGQLAPQSRDPLLWERPEIQVEAVNAVSGEDMQSAYYDAPDLALENFIGITAYDASDPFDLKALELGLDEFLKANPEFQASQDHPGAAELSGEVTISGAVVVPKSVKLIIKPGADITMMPSSSLVSYGGLQAIGTPEQRIHIHGDSSGEAWGTFAVVRPEEEVLLSYVDFQDGGQAQVNAILFTGGFAVHDGDLKLEHCSFTHMQSEDGFNLKNGHLYMDDILVSGNASDGVDLDFVTGEVHNSQFLNNAGDGLDLSGNHITITDSRFEYNGDKGLSVGEDSHPIVVNALFRGNQIGLSTKDLSNSRVAYATYVDNVLAIEAKRKKAFFGGGSGEFVNIVFSGNQTLLKEDYFSQGLVTIQSSLTDDQEGCRACGFANINFQNSTAGDFRLSAGSDIGEEFTLVKPDWLVLDGKESLPDLPGVFLVSPSNNGHASP